ncbi:MAG TPA: hypothetical protein VHL57_06315 [Flavobacteriales bacterium]|jgi:hypothetical protein|nr:hypothetical protein [Flavobacteriales bacterium]
MLALIALDIPAGWTVLKNAFYDIGEVDRLSESDRWAYLFGLNDMLMLTKGAYCLDLGWYGGADVHGPRSGYRLHLLRGAWYNGELLERFSSKDRHVIADRVQRFMRQVDAGAYEGRAPLPWTKEQADGSALAER